MHVGQGMPNKVSYRPPDMIDHRTLDDDNNNDIIWGIYNAQTYPA